MNTITFDNYVALDATLFLPLLDASINNKKTNSKKFSHNNIIFTQASYENQVNSISDGNRIAFFYPTDSLVQIILDKWNEIKRYPSGIQVINKKYPLFMNTIGETITDLK